MITTRPPPPTHSLPDNAKLFSSAVAVETSWSATRGFKEDTLQKTDLWREPASVYGQEEGVSEGSETVLQRDWMDGGRQGGWRFQAPSPSYGARKCQAALTFSR